MILYPPLFQTSLGTPRDLATLISLISQKFGENIQYYQDHELGNLGHSGIDWPCVNGTPIYASHDGIVAHATIDQYGGKYIKLEQGNWGTIYGHLKEFCVSEHQFVEAGQLIGYSDNTGFSTGSHLHWGLKLDGKWINPLPYLVWKEYNTIMTKEEVRNIYRLAFYREPTEEESNYWVGKALADFLKTAIADRAKFLEQI